MPMTIVSIMQQLVSNRRNETALAIHWFRQNNMQVNREKIPTDILWQ